MSDNDRWLRRPRPSRLSGLAGRTQSIAQQTHQRIARPLIERRLAIGSQQLDPGIDSAAHPDVIGLGQPGRHGATGVVEAHRAPGRPGIDLLIGLIVLIVLTVLMVLSCLSLDQLDQVGDGSPQCDLGPLGVRLGVATPTTARTWSRLSSPEESACWRCGRSKRRSPTWARVRALAEEKPQRPDRYAASEVAPRSRNACRRWTSVPSWTSCPSSAARTRAVLSRWASASSFENAANSALLNGPSWTLTVSGPASVELLALRVSDAVVAVGVFVAIAQGTVAASADRYRSRGGGHERVQSRTAWVWPGGDGGGSDVGTWKLVGMWGCGDVGMWRPDAGGSRRGQSLTATVTSISTAPPRGSAATPMAERV